MMPIFGHFVGGILGDGELERFIPAFTEDEHDGEDRASRRTPEASSERGRVRQAAA